MILFRPKFEDADHETPDFSLVLSKKHTYDIVRISPRVHDTVPTNPE